MSSDPKEKLSFPNSEAVEVLRKSAQELVAAIRAVPEEKLLELDADPHPPSALSELADSLDAALASLSAPKPYGEWVLVPREATPEMWEAGMNCHSPDDTQGDYLEKAWGAMLAAAPKPESAEAVGEVFGPKAVSTMVALERPLPPGTKLYTAPPRPEASAPVGVEDVIRQELRSALAWGATYGKTIPGHQWDEMRDRMVEQHLPKITAALEAQQPAPVAPVGVRLPDVPFAVFDEFGVGADDRIMDYGRACAEAALAQQPAAVDEAAVQWAVERWNDEVANRPLVNVHRRSLDDAWRQVIRHFGGDDVTLCGPRHDDLAGQQQESGNG